ncbi:MAG: SBBP repeat-containing protein [Candidatus Thorarchaeota archaeon]
MKKLGFALVIIIVILDIHFLHPDYSTLKIDELTLPISEEQNLELIKSIILSGSDFDRGQSFAVDSSGNLYGAGITMSDNFPMKNAYDSTYDGSHDLFIFKLSPDGEELLYSTYFGGSDQEECGGIAVDSEGCLYITGSTRSEEFPIIDAYSDEFQGGEEAFLIKLNESGYPIYSTFFGGSERDFASGITVDSEGNVYVCGSTQSNDIPLVNQLDSSFAGPNEAYVYKMNPQGTSLLFSTFIGGSGWEVASSISLDTDSDICIVGSTQSSDFPVKNALDDSLDLYHDCFILKIANDGGSLIFSTFVGGSHDDGAYSVTTDSSKNIYVTGSTKSTDFPMTNPYCDTRSGSEDCFVLKLHTSGSELYYSTYIGGSETDYGNSIAVDSEGKAYVTGITWSVDFPVSHAYDSYFDSGGESNSSADDFDCFVLELSSNGSALDFSSFVGGVSYDIGESIFLTPNRIYIGGSTRVPDFPSPVVHGSNSGIEKCFLAEFSFGLIDIETTTDTFSSNSPISTSNDTEPSDFEYDPSIGIVTGIGIVVFLIAAVIVRRRVVKAYPYQDF